MFQSLQTIIRRRNPQFLQTLMALLFLGAIGLETQAQHEGSFQLQKEARLRRVMARKGQAASLNKGASSGNLRTKGPSTQAIPTLAVTAASNTPGGQTLQSIVQALVGNGVTVSNVTCNAPDSLRAVGSFSNGTGIFGINTGLLMTSGSVDLAVGPNKTSYTSQDNQMPAYDAMDPNGFDATIIDFDLVSTTNLMTFKYVFASEEYNEFVGSGFNDQFGFFISGPGYEQATNIALIPGTSTSVEINNVNYALNQYHYINNDNFDTLVPNPDKFNAIEYDGFTRPLTTTTLNLVPGATYHLRLVVQDVGDHIYDSGVFIEGGSISSDLCVMQLFPEVYDITTTGNGADGKIEVYVSGANGIAHGVWSNGVTEELELYNVGPGTYNVVVTDDAGCVATLPAPIVMAIGSHTGGGVGGVDTTGGGGSGGGGGGGGGGCNDPANPGPISGPENVCPSSVNILYSIEPVEDATTYEWSLPAGASGTSSTNSISVSFSAGFTGGDIEVIALNDCGESNNEALTIGLAASAAKPATPAAILGSGAGVCYSTTKTFSVAAVPNAVSYTWTVPAGATLVSGQGSKEIEVAFAATFTTGTLSVKAGNCAGQSLAKTLALSKTTAVPASIAGPTREVCAGSTQTYSCPAVAGASVYNWTVPAGASIDAGEGTNTITVTFPVPFTTGKITVSSGTDCYTSGLRSITLYSIPSVPASITGPALGVCAGTNQTYTCPVSTTGATEYQWSVPGGATFTGGATNSISVTFPDNFGASGNITVAASNACGTSSNKVLLVRSVPAAPASVTGPASGVCAGSTVTYTCPASATGASGFNWTVPAGASINSGQGSNSISVTLPTPFTTGTISVSAVNSCGSSTAKSLAIRSVTAQPGAITGQANNLCGGGVFTYSIAAVAGASTYNWTAPAGCSIELNGGTSISMTVPATFTTGSLSVVAQNGCGNSTARTLSLTRLPGTPASITGSTAICPGATNLNFSTPQVGAYTYTWSAPAGSVITAGQGSASATLNWGTVAGNISVKAVNACGSSAAKNLAVALVACREVANGEEVPANVQASIFPNPGNGEFTLEINGLQQEGLVRIYNMKGSLVMEQTIGQGIKNHSLHLTNEVPGIYLVRILAEGYHQEIRVVKQ